MGAPLRGQTGQSGELMAPNTSPAPSLRNDCYVKVGVADPEEGVGEGQGPIT